MIQVISKTFPGEIKPVDFDSNAVEIIEGALIVYAQDAKDLLAGFAPGSWLGFQKFET